MKDGCQEHKHERRYPRADDDVINLIWRHLSVVVGVLDGEAPFQSYHEEADDHHEEESVVYVHLHVPRMKRHHYIVHCKPEVDHL